MPLRDHPRYAEYIESRAVSDAGFAQTLTFRTARIRSRTRGRDPELRFGPHFNVDFMGQAEYDFDNTCEPAFDLLMEKRGTPVVIKSVSMTCSQVERTVFVVGFEDEVDTRATYLQQWLQDPMSVRSQSMFRECFTGERGWITGVPYQQDAWWGLKTRLFWTLDEPMARLLQYSINNYLGE